MSTLKDFWQNFSGIVDFFDKNGQEIDDMDYPLDTQILEEKEMKDDYRQVTLNVPNE